MSLFKYIKSFTITVINREAKHTVKRNTTCFACLTPLTGPDFFESIVFYLKLMFTEGFEKGDIIEPQKPDLLERCLAQFSHHLNGHRIPVLARKFHCQGIYWGVSGSHIPNMATLRHQIQSLRHSSWLCTVSFFFFFFFFWWYIVKRQMVDGQLAIG
jgi:hypothetical protein